MSLEKETGASCANALETASNKNTEIGVRTGQPGIVGNTFRFSLIVCLLGRALRRPFGKLTADSYDPSTPTCWVSGYTVRYLHL